MSGHQDVPIRCHQCGHGYAKHQPDCRSAGGCDCAAFRWVDPAPAPDLLGYHRAPLVV